MNQLKMDIKQTISTLSRAGWSQRRIARELGIDRETVARYRRLARQVEEPKPAIPPAGSEPLEGANPAMMPPGPELTTAPSHPSAEPPNPAIAPAGLEPIEGPNPATVTPGPEVTAAPGHPSAEPPNPAISPPGSKAGRVSHCQPFESVI